MKHGATLTYVQGGKTIRFAPDSDFWITVPPNLSGQTVNLSETQSGGQVGTTVNAMNVGGKDLTFDGTIMRNVENNRDLMIDVIAPMRKSRIVYEYAGVQYFIDGWAKRTPNIGGGIVIQDFQFVFRAPFPYWTPVLSETVNVRGLTNLFAFPFVLSGDQIYISQFSEEAYVEIIYAGNTEVGMQIDMMASAPVTAPEVYSVYKSQWIRFSSLTMNANDYMSINTTFGQRRMTLTRNDGTVENGLRYLDIDSTASLTISPGVNLIRSDASEGVGNLRINVTLPKGGVKSGV